MMRLLYILLPLLFLLACNSEVKQQLDSKNPALGKLNQVVVIADEELWKGAVGDTFRFYFESAYPILPAPESIFDIKFYTPNQLVSGPTRKELRTYIILADLSDAESSTTKMVKKDMGSEKYNSAMNTGKPFTSLGKDKWAKGQFLAYMGGANEEVLIQTIKKSYPAIARRINEHDQPKLKAMSFGIKSNKGLSRMVRENYYLDIDIPVEYTTARRDSLNNVLWLVRRTNEADMHLVFKKYRYDNPNQVSKDSIISWRNDFGQNYVTSDIEDNFMIVNEQDLPVYEYVHDIDGSYTKELRGIWEMTKEFTGGPFATYVVVLEDKKELIYIDAFVLAPGHKKRNYMMQLDCIVKSAKVNS